MAWRAELLGTELGMEGAEAAGVWGRGLKVESGTREDLKELFNMVKLVQVGEGGEAKNVEEDEE